MYADNAIRAAAAGRQDLAALAGQLRPWAPVALLGAAAGLRFWGLDAGIPGNLAADEPQIMNRAVHMMRTGSLNPNGFFDYPGLYLYIQTAAATCWYLLGATAGWWHALHEVTVQDFYLFGRVVTASFGTATVFLVYQIGRRWDPACAILAAAVMAVLPMHVRESHYVLTDVPLTFFVALTFLLTLRALDGPRAASFVLAGCAAGLAAATKYPGAVVLVLPLIAAAMIPGGRRTRAAAAVAASAACAATFLLAAPYTLLDLPGFLNGYGKLTRALVQSPPEPGWLLYLKHLRTNLQWPALGFAAAGLGLSIVRAVHGPARGRWVLLTAFPLLFFWLLSAQSLIYARYLLPLGPFIALLIATGILGFAGSLRRYVRSATLRAAAAAVCAVAVLAGPTARAVGFNRMIARTTTAEMAYEWILQNVPRGSSIVIETSGLQLPALYNARNVPQLSNRSLEAYRQDGVEYLVASSQGFGRALGASHTAPREYAAYMNIFGLTREVARFTPSDAHPGPELRILKVQP